MKSLRRLPGVYERAHQDNHQIIDKALQMGCTDTHPISKDDLEQNLSNIPGIRDHIASMKTEAGNSHGMYFTDAPENNCLVFHPQVWAKLLSLGWAQKA